MIKMYFKTTIKIIFIGLFLVGLSCQQNKQEKIEDKKQKLYQLIKTKNKTENKTVNHKNKNSTEGQPNPQRGSTGIGNYDFGTVPNSNIKFRPPVNSATDLKKQRETNKKNHSGMDKKSD
ncbi:MAG: hypothetical protein ACQES9_03885 [Myxococcota bacterium]